MEIHGVVTRLVAADDQKGIGPRVFFRPADPKVLRELDGSKQCASGEIAVVVTDLAQYEIGDEADFTVG